MRDCRHAMVARERHDVVLASDIGVEFFDQGADGLVESDEGVFDFPALGPIRVPDDVQRRKADGQDVGLLTLPEFVKIGHPRGHSCEIFI